MSVDSVEIVSTDVELGAHAGKDAVTFTVWAPRHESMMLRLNDRDIAMEPRPDGYHTVTVPGARAGQRYWFKLKDDLRPDPASRYQPQGVFGPRRLSIPRRSRGQTGTGPALRPAIATSSTRCTSGRSRRPARGVRRARSCSGWRTSA